uniref:Uncharacterized protein n=1 Tax=Picea glauca TaxID=3330 RepID=A0A101M5T2_PICGL|nr:hypothetical protein ABT39_MTgene1239 [Picea glauca]QHR90417.1 hypothetical protein Q903MT_gene4441 [Picea sitchensis]
MLAEKANILSKLLLFISIWKKLFQRACLLLFACWLALSYTPVWLDCIIHVCWTYTVSLYVHGFRGTYPDIHSLVMYCSPHPPKLWILHDCTTYFY